MDVATEAEWIKTKTLLQNLYPEHDFNEAEKAVLKRRWKSKNQERLRRAIEDSFAVRTFKRPNVGHIEQLYRDMDRIFRARLQTEALKFEGPPYTRDEAEVEVEEMRADLAAVSPAKLDAAIRVMEHQCKGLLDQNEEIPLLSEWAAGRVGLCWAALQGISD